ncbi:hypothetical protein [uncultured Eudoraea sp.]|uniref:hypothetical protein n=1 Tax=uncultured Eudoraea sp. TaxID=1035614 RepID=UPI002620288B|nr:hypothetical protein [uncultured Eudoraea sp.]
MKKNMPGLFIVILSTINILYTLSLFFNYSYDLITIGYMIGGTIISIFFIFLIIKNNKFGYWGIILFYGVQIIGTTLVFQNYRFGPGIILSQSLENIISDSTLEINFTALIPFILGIAGLKKLKKIK